jgi:hypothetical protein
MFPSKAPASSLLLVRFQGPQLPPSLNSPFNYESISGLVHRLGQCLHDPLTSQKPHLWQTVLGTNPSTHEPFGFISKPY